MRSLQLGQVHVPCRCARLYTSWNAHRDEPEEGWEEAGDPRREPPEELAVRRLDQDGAVREEDRRRPPYAPLLGDGPRQLFHLFRVLAMIAPLGCEPLVQGPHKRRVGRAVVDGRPVR